MGIVEVIVENGRMFGRLERYLGIVGASTLLNQVVAMGWNGLSMVNRRAWSSSQWELSRSCVRARSRRTMEHAVVWA